MTIVTTGPLIPVKEASFCNMMYSCKILKNQKESEKNGKAYQANHSKTFPLTKSLLGIEADDRAPVRSFPGLCLPGMAIDHFEGRWQTPFFNQCLVPGTRLKPGRTSHQSVPATLH